MSEQEIPNNQANLLSVEISLSTDTDIIAWTWRQESVEKSIKRLIRKEIAGEQRAQYSTRRHR